MTEIIFQVNGINRNRKFCKYYWDLVSLAFFSNILQNNLDSLKNHWNTHRIGESRFQTKHGRPNILYEFPSRSWSQEGLKFAMSNEMFDLAAASFIEEEYSED